MIKKFKTGQGFSLLELVVAIAIFVIIISGMSVLASGNYLSGFENQERTQAQAMLTETWEALKAIRNNDWGSISNGTHGLTNIDNYWELYGTSDTYSGIIRQITISDIRRDDGGHISDSGEIDPDSKSVTIELNWSPVSGTEQNISVQTYLHNYSNPSDWPPEV